MLTQTLTISKTAALVLVRLLTPPARLSPATLRKSLDPFFRGRDPGAWQAHFNETLAALERDGLITRRPPALTEAGRGQALEFLGLEELPPGMDWKQLKSKYLAPAALGIQPADSEQRKRIAKADGLRAAILQVHYHLPAVKNLTQALDALVWKELGFDGTTAPLKPAVLREKILSQVLELEGKFDLKKFKSQLPAHAVDANRAAADDLRTALLREWLKDAVAEGTGPAEETAPAAEEPTAVVETMESRPSDAVAPVDAESQPPAPLEAPTFDLGGFASRVQAAARGSESGRFGDNKVFISHVWRKLQSDNAFPDMTGAEFRNRLTEANRQGLLHLSRADLVEVMDPTDVRESETPYLHAVFHFVQV